MLDENIRVMRREKGLTQEQLAEVMGVSTASVSKWETGVAVPELGMLAALADFFEVSIDALIGHTVGKVQLKEKTAAITELSLAGEDEKAIEQAKKPHQLIHTAFESSQVVQMLTAMGEEELLAVAKEELGN